MRTAGLRPRPDAEAGGETAEARRERVRHRAEQLGATLPPLLVAAERVAATVAQGVHGRRRVGRGEAFWQFRRYTTTDPLQAIDWRQSAKSDALYVREKEWEAAESVWLWRDGSASMRYRSSRRVPEKEERAELLLLALASLLLRGGERVAILGTGRAPSSGRAALERMSQELAEAPAGGPAGGGLPPVAPLPRFSRAVMIGDFLSPLEKVAAVVRAYAARGVVCHLLQILDPAEETLPFEGRVRFEGLEREAPVLVSRVENLRRAYIERMAAHQEALGALARSTQGSFAWHATDRPPEAALLTLYEALEAPPAGYRREAT